MLKIYLKSLCTYYMHHAVSDGWCP